MPRPNFFRRQLRVEAPIVALTSHFFRRFFDNEFVSRSRESALGVTQLLILLGLPGVLYFFFAYLDYSVIAKIAPNFYEPTAMRDQFGYICLSMIVMGLVALLEWDALFPDRLDFLTLTPLPLSVRRIFLAKIAALLAFLFLFAAAVGVPGMVLFPMAASLARHVTFGGRVWWILIHGLTVAAASAFSFLFFVGLEGLLLCALSYRWFERISPYIQGVLIAATLLFSLFLPQVRDNLPLLMKGRSRLIPMLPPMWFWGLYRELQGYSGPAYHLLAVRALRALAAVALVSIAAYWVSYRRSLKRTLEIREEFRPEPGRARQSLCRLANRVYLTRPLERATFSFVFKTLLGSRRHRLVFSAYAGVGIALALESFAALLSRDAASAPLDRAAILLTVPLILSFFALSGMRLIFEIPAEIRANWLFQLTAQHTSPELVSGIRKAMIALGTLPLLTIVVPIHFLQLRVGAAIAALLLDCILSLILIEVLLLHLRRIPFTCSYLAGKTGNLAVWLACWLGFTSYAYTLARTESWVMHDPTGFVVLAGLLLAALIWLGVYNQRFQSQGVPLEYETEAQPVVQTLDLSHAALDRLTQQPAAK
jgi:hypothetical protein